MLFAVYPKQPAMESMWPKHNNAAAWLRIHTSKNRLERNASV